MPSSSRWKRDGKRSTLDRGPVRLIVEWNETLDGFYGRAMGDSVLYNTEPFATEEEAQNAILDLYQNRDRATGDD